MKKEFKTPPITIGAYPVNDLDRAARFVQELKHEALYISTWKQWVIWDGKHWGRDITGGEIMRRAMNMPKILEAEAAAITDSGLHKKAMMSAIMAGNEERLTKMVKLARSFPEVDKSEMVFDQNPWIIGVQNGVVDLKTQSFRDAKLEDYVLRKMNVEYDPVATCQPWLDALKTSLPNPDVRNFVQRAIGYSITGNVSEQVWFFCWGHGQNGKSTFVETVSDIMGDYAHKAPAKLFLQNKHGTSPEGSIAQLNGRRFVVGSEIPESAQLAEGLIKDLASDDRLSGRLLYENDQTFVPTHHLFLSGNVKPVIKSTDLGTWRRIKLIPFDVTIQNRDLDIKKKLRAVSPGVLNWMLEGCRQWQTSGLQAPPEVEVATADYKEEEDLVGQFISEVCIIDGTECIPKGDLYAAFKAWAILNGENERYIPGIKTFGKRMGRPGIREDLDPDPKKRTRMWVGINLTEPNRWPKLA
jgi:putative DNA primase/helicase